VLSVAPSVHQMLIEQMLHKKQRVDDSSPDPQRESVYVVASILQPKAKPPVQSAAIPLFIPKLLREFLK